MIPKTDKLAICTILSCFLAHALITEHAPLLEHRRTGVNCNMYNTGAPTFSIISHDISMHDLLSSFLPELGIGSVHQVLHPKPVSNPTAPE